MDSGESPQKQTAVQNHPPQSSFPVLPIESAPANVDIQDLDGLPDLVDSSGSESDTSPQDGFIFIGRIISDSEQFNECYNDGRDEFKFIDIEYQIITLDFLADDSVFTHMGGFTASTSSAAQALDEIGLPKAVLFTVLLQYVGPRLSHLIFVQGGGSVRLNEM